MKHSVLWLCLRILYLPCGKWLKTTGMPAWGVGGATPTTIRVRIKRLIKMDAFDLFNTALVDFITDMGDVYDGAKNLKNALALSIVLDRKLAFRMFKEHVAEPYGTFIKNKDEVFLMNQEFSETKRITATTSNTLDIDIVGQLKSVWTTLSTDNKDAIWAHLDQLVRMAARIR
jgi:hypothetical protein